jgi:DNA-binding NtrC family response regulator
MAMTQVRTLVVDDEEGVRFFLTKTLQLDGHTVATAASGESALDQLRESSFDLVMLDLRLGGRVDGMRVLEAVKWRSFRSRSQKPISLGCSSISYPSSASNAPATETWV